MDDLLNKNLSNTQREVNLFGEKEDKLAMRDRIGFLPISIWQPDWSKVRILKSVIGDTAQTRAIMPTSDFRNGQGHKRQTKTSYNTALGNRKNDLSIFNPHLAQMILSAYCPPKAIIFDPFAGGGTRGFIASAMGHQYIGQELRKEEVERIVRQQQKLDKEFVILCGDSAKIAIQENYFDFSYTCPPYFNLEIYSDLAEDLSNAKDYGKFLDMLKAVMRNVFVGLKQGGLSVWVVGNFRDNRGRLIHFNGDVIRIAEEIGFVLHDELIFWGAAGSAVQRCGQFEANRKSVRVHEYIIILKKQ